jgi:hypothetical protein
VRRRALFSVALLLAAFACQGLIAQARSASPDQSVSNWLKPQIQAASRHDVSLPLLDLARQAAPQPDRPAHPTAIERINRLLPVRRLDPKQIDDLAAQGIDPAEYFQQTDPVIQDQAPSLTAMPATRQNFEGVPNVNFVLPPDPVGDIGYDETTGKRYYVQWVNWTYAIWDVTSTPLKLAQSSGNTPWNGFGGPCEFQNSGDPIVLFDQLANRWLLSQFALPNYPFGPFYTCVAISTSADPAGAYYRYEFETTAAKMNDYPHWGVWPDGYYMTVNQFNQGSLSWGGAGAFAFERDRMLNGQSARMVYFDLFNVNSNYGGLLPTDLEGLLPPAAGAPNYFVEVDDNSLSALGPEDALRLWKFHVDWADPASSTFGLNGLPNLTLAVAPFNVLPCTLYSQSRSCIPQPGAPSVDAVGDRIMHRLTYRNFGAYEVLLLNHTVDAGSGRAGIRWYEVRDPGGAASIHQQSTYAPDDGASRWMGSLAMDHRGNIALGYSVSSSSIYPSIRYAGRLVTDPIGQLAQGEASLIEGSGSQLSFSQRWGDYSSMNVDPVDDCTFWYTQEYYAVTSQASWQTRIASFQYPNCTNGAAGMLRGAARDALTSTPIPNARVVLAASPDLTITTTTDAGGVYTQVLPIGPYTMTTSAYGYGPSIISPVVVTFNTTTTQDVLLTPVPTYQVTGTVHDSSTTDPLYAVLVITGTPFTPPHAVVATNPDTGYYSVTLASDQSYTLTAAAPLHASASRTFVFTSNRVEDFNLVSTTIKGGLIGWVKNLNTALPVVQAQVALTPTGIVTLTDAAGYFQFLDLDPGSYTVTATAPWYQTTSADSIPVKSGIATPRIMLLPASRLNYEPTALSQNLSYGTVLTEAARWTISNTGQLSLTYHLSEVPDSPWLSTIPAEGVLAAANTQALTLTWNAAVLNQPGIYTTSLFIDSNDPAAWNTVVPVTLTVSPSATMGLITGVISTTGRCDVNAAHLTNAVLVVQNSQGFFATTSTDAAGEYRYWLLDAGSPYTVTVTAADHSITATAIAVTAGSTAINNFTLRLQQPCLSLTPTALTATVNPGGIITSQLFITNSGAVPLDFAIYEVVSAEPYGGPDAFGYSWRPAVYDWIEVSDGQALNLPDDGEVTLTLPFAFPFYDRASNFLRVGNNGAVLFDTQSGDVPFINLSMSQAPDDFLAPYWDDLSDSQGNVYWKTVGNAPDRRVVIQWANRPHADLDPDSITFEMILHESGDIVFQYQDVDFGDASDDAGASATVGMRGRSAAQSVEYSFARPALLAQQAICFARPGHPPCDAANYPWLTVAPTTTLIGLGGTPQTQIVSVTLDAVPVLPGDRPQGALRLISNDPARPWVDIPVVFDIAWKVLYFPLMTK